VARGEREQWASRLGVILAVAGSAVGLGNFLRFPGLAAKYGGGAFMIPYFVSLLLLGIPICWCEWTLGRYGGNRGFNSAPGIFRVLTRSGRSTYFGVLAILVPLVIYMYYVFIESWCLAYSWYYITGAMPQSVGTDTGPFVEFFARFVGMNENGFLLEGTSHLSPAVIFLLIAFVLNFYLVYQGLSKGIETFCKWAMPALIVAALLVLLRVLTLGTPNPELPERNVSNGLGFMWNLKLPEGGGIWSYINPISNPEIWLQAAGQIFFTLSVGFGIVMTYASYLRAKDDVVLSGLTASATNEFCEVCLGGLITVPAAYIFLGGDTITNAAGSSLKMGFLTLPAVFERMPIGHFFGFLWFFLLFLAAITSSISMLQPVIAFLEEGFNLGRKASVTILGLISLIGSFFVVYFSKDLEALDTMDFWVGQVCIFLLGTATVVFFGWVLGIEKGLEEAHRGAHIRIPKIFRFVIRYVSPVYLIGIFCLFINTNVIEGYQQEGSYVYKILHSSVTQMTIGFILIVTVFFTILVHLARRRWETAELTQKGEI
jgi:neurotransmitter:Na+ symporter, NSS family